MNIINKNIEEVYNDIKSIEFSKNLLNYTSYEIINNNKIFYIKKNINKYLKVIPEQLINFIEGEKLCYELKEIVKKYENSFIISYECNIISPVNLAEILQDFIIIVNIKFSIDTKNHNNTLYDTTISYKENSNILVTLCKDIINIFINEIILNIIKNKVICKIDNYYISKI